MKNSSDYDFKLNYQGHYIKSLSNTKFLALIIDDYHEGSYRPNDVKIEYNMFCNLNDTSYNVSRNFKNGLFCIHNSIMSYGIIFWGNQPYSDKIFKIKKRVIRIITNSRMRDSCRELFKN